MGHVMAPGVKSIAASRTGRPGWQDKFGASETKVAPDQTVKELAGLAREHGRPDLAEAIERLKMFDPNSTLFGECPVYKSRGWRCPHYPIRPRPNVVEV